MDGTVLYNVVRGQSKSRFVLRCVEVVSGNAPVIRIPVFCVIDGSGSQRRNFPVGIRSKVSWIIQRDHIAESSVRRNHQGLDYQAIEATAVVYLLHQYETCSAL